MFADDPQWNNLLVCKREREKSNENMLQHRQKWPIEFCLCRCQLFIGLVSVQLIFCYFIRNESHMTQIKF